MSRQYFYLTYPMSPLFLTLHHIVSIPLYKVVSLDFLLQNLKSLTSPRPVLQYSHNNVYRIDPYYIKTHSHLNKIPLSVYVS